MNTKKLRVLVLEDRATDAELLVREVRRAGFEPEWQRVETEEDYLAALDTAPDLILADYSLPHYDGLQAVQALRGRGLDTPFILVTGTMGEEAAVEAMKHGATDYLLKDRVARLGAAVKQALEARRLREERQRAEEALRESEAHLKNLLQALPAAVYTCDVQGRITFCNEAASRLWGKAPELDRDHWSGAWKIYQPGGSPLPFEEHPMAVTLREGRAVHGQEIVIERRDGSRANVSHNATPIRSLDGVLIGAVNMLVDITEQKQAEAAIRESHALYTSLVETLPQTIFRKDREGRFTFANRRFCLTLGRTEAEVLGRTDAELFAAERAAKYRQDDLRVMETGLPFEEEEQFRDVQGRELYVQVSKFPLLNAAGDVTGVQGVFTDITARKQAEEAVRQRAKELERFHRLSVGREMDMIQLKKEVNELATQAGRKAPYDLAFLAKPPLPNPLKTP